MCYASKFIVGDDLEFTQITYDTQPNKIKPKTDYYKKYIKYKNKYLQLVQYINKSI